MLTFATKVTLLRILLVPLVIVLMYFETPVTCTLAMLAFIVASLTDWLDGWIARKNNEVTNMGKFLDPLADKVLVCAVLIMFVMHGWAPAWVVIVIICRELVITGLRTIAIDEGIVIAADKFGKMKTVLQMIAIIPLMYHYPFFGLNLNVPGLVFLYLSMLMAVYSCYNYCRGFWLTMRSRSSGSSSGDTPR